MMQIAPIEFVPTSALIPVPPTAMLKLHADYH